MSVSSISLLEYKIIAAAIVVVPTELETQMGGRVERISTGEMSVCEAAGIYPKTEMDLGHPLEKN